MLTAISTNPHEVKPADQFPRQGKRSAGAVVLRKKNYTDCGVRGKKQQHQSNSLLRISKLISDVMGAPTPFTTTYKVSR